MKTFYRTVVLDKDGNVDLIVWQSKNFTKCLEEARKLIRNGADPGHVDILSRNDAELWVSVCEEWIRLWEIERGIDEVAP